MCRQAVGVDDTRSLVHALLVTVWEMGGKTSTLRPELKKGEGGRDGRAGEVQGRTKEVGAGEV